MKQDNAALTARIHMLEEHIRELEVLYLYLVCICICIYLSLYLYLYLNQCTTSNSWLLQVRGEERVEEEQRRSRELMQRVERERQLEVDDPDHIADVGADADFD